MITVAGRPLDMAELNSAYPGGSVERLTLDKMFQSTQQYQYDSLDVLKFELRLRKEIVQAALELGKSRLSFAVFHKSKSNPQFWERTPNGGFLLKSGVKPSDAIEDIYKNSGDYATECATAMMIVYYRALLAVFGPDRFNKLFPEIYLMNWNINEPLLREVGMPRKTNDYLLGDRAYFRNPDVDPKVPEWQGENAIVLPDSLYYGHGVGIHTADRIIRALNSNRREGSTRSAYLTDAVARPNFQRLAKLASGPA